MTELTKRDIAIGQDVQTLLATILGTYVIGNYTPEEQLEGWTRLRRAIDTQIVGETLSLSFGGDASEGFAARIGEMRGWYVRITPRGGGEPFDAVILAPGVDEQWLDAVTFQRAADGEVIEGAEVETIRVSDVYIY